MFPLTDCGRSLTRLRVWLPVALLAGVISSACAKKVVVVAAEPPPLAVPVVPPRLVGPVMVEEEAPQPVEEVPERPAPRTPPRAPRVTRGTPDAGKPADGSSVEPPRPEPAEPAPPPTSEQPATLLRTPETADDREAVRRVRDILSRAQENLSKVNYKALSTERKAQHDTATRLMAQAEEALRAHSFTFARFVADKAEVLSNSLLNR